MEEQFQQPSSENPQSQGRELNEEEAIKFREGMAVKEMMATQGWKVLEGWLKSRAFHSWVDPREAKSEEQWLWQEMNAFHSADVAKQILFDLKQLVEVADQLEDIRLGRKQPKTMRV